MDLAEFLSKKDEIDFKEFYEEIGKKVAKIQEEFSPFVTLVKEFQLPREGKLKGLPISVKDCICTKGIQTTAGSKILEGYIPPFDATAVERLKKEGAIVIGKTSQDEFGFGTFNVNTSFPIPKNPYDKERSCGGSSGGSACITALADFPHISLAESTGGSISCPAAFCGVVGLTPTYGLVSRWGLIDYGTSLDKIGVMAKKVQDVAIALSLISGYDPKDSTCLNVPQKDYTQFLVEGVEDIKIGVPKEYFENVDERIVDVVWKGIKKLEEMGAEYEEISLPLTKYALPCYYILAMSEASTNLAKFCGMRYGAQLNIKGNFNEYFSKVRTLNFGEEAKRRIILGTFARMAGFRKAYYLRACKVRTKIILEFKKAFEKFDALISPTMPILPPRFDEIEELEPIEIYTMDMLTVAPNLAGIPHLSFPIGFVKGLPVGLHILGDHLAEDVVLRIAYNLEVVK